MVVKSHNALVKTAKVSHKTMGKVLVTNKVVTTTVVHVLIDVHNTLRLLRQKLKHSVLKQRLSRHLKSLTQKQLNQRRSLKVADTNL